jgi:hypothetical protein
MNVITDWMQSTWIFDFLVANNAWVWPALETSHFFGMCLLFGALIIIDLRLIGWEKASAVAETDKLAVVVLIGFGINFVTGIFFCFGDPNRYFVNIAFQIKLALILLAGLNFFFYKFKVIPIVTGLGPGEDTPTTARFAGVASFVLWLGVLCFGRLIPYLEFQ